MSLCAVSGSQIEDMGENMRALIATRFVPALAALFLLAGCATTIKTSQALDSQTQASVIVKEVTANLAPDVKAPADTPQKLEEAVMNAASAHTDGTTPVKLSMTITLWSVRDAGTRFVGGALAGSNKMDVSVDVIDASGGNVIGHYEVQRRSNPGGYGMFYDQAQATITEGAKGVIEGLYSKSK